MISVPICGNYLQIMSAAASADASSAVSADASSAYRNGWVLIVFEYISCPQDIKRLNVLS